MDCADGSDEVKELCTFITWVTLIITLMSVNSF